MKYFIGLGIICILILLMCIDVTVTSIEEKTEPQHVRLSIYTPSNIYVINGLHVKGQNGVIDITCKDLHSLEDLISTLTVNDTEKCMYSIKKEVE